MNIESYRSSFSVYVMDSDLDSGQVLSRKIESAGYQAQLVLNEQNFNEQLKINPPHTVIIPYLDSEFSKDYAAAEDRIQSLISVLPELNIIFLAKDEDIEEAHSLYKNGIYAILSNPVYPDVELIHCLDRAAKQNYYMYLNEQLVASNIESNDLANIQYFEIWAEKFKSSPQPSDWIQSCLQELKRIQEGMDYIYLKFIPAKASLVVEASEGFDGIDLDSVGIDLTQTEPRFRQAQLSDPEKILGLRDLVKNGLQKPDFIALSCFAGSRVDGVLLALPTEGDMPAMYGEAYFRLCLKFLGLQLALLENRNKLERYSIVDEGSSALNRRFFIEKINEEIVRARRISKPISLLIIQLDHFYEKALEADEYEVDKFLKSITSVFAKNSRLNDLVGRLAPDQFGLLLPHTPFHGAAIKGERLRRIIETANFSKIYPYIEKLTISVGIAEYPRMAATGSELLKKADEALSEVIRQQGNRVCISQVSDDFNPDFKVEE